MYTGPGVLAAGSAHPLRLADRCCVSGSEVRRLSAAADLPWREFFTDKRLQQVIETALNNNRDLRLAVLNVERARALYGIQRAELLPSVNAVGSGSKARVPADSRDRTGDDRERYDVNLGISAWEIDFFGRIRSLRDRALEEYLATDQARRGAQLLLVSSTAQALPHPGRGPGNPQDGTGHPGGAGGSLSADPETIRPRDRLGAGSQTCPEPGRGGPGGGRPMDPGGGPGSKTP